MNLAFLIFFLFLSFSLGHTHHMLDIMSHLAQVVASLRTSMAARCVKFAPGSSHLLAIAEHQGTAHLVNYATSWHSCRYWFRIDFVYLGLLEFSILV